MNAGSTTSVSDAECPERVDLETAPHEAVTEDF